MVDVPGPVDFHFNFGFPPGKAYACMAETMALALEGRFEDYTLGKHITRARVDEISAIAKKARIPLERVPFVREGSNTGTDRSRAPQRQTREARHNTGRLVWEKLDSWSLKTTLDIANMLKIYFSGMDYEVDIAPRGGLALEKTRTVLPHLIVLDIMLPDIDGYEVCRTVADEHAHQPHPGHFPDPEG